MIRRELKRQLIELEKRYAVAVEAKRDQETAPARGACYHAVKAAAVVLHGEPKIDEPLKVACKRMQEKLDKEFAAAAQELWIHAFGQKGHPDVVASFYPDLMFHALRGADDNLKFEQIFSNS